jgi:hypothetical protein
VQDSHVRSTLAVHALDAFLPWSKGSSAFRPVQTKHCRHLDFPVDGWKKSSGQAVQVSLPASE